MVSGVIIRVCNIIEQISIYCILPVSATAEEKTAIKMAEIAKSLKIFHLQIFERKF